MVIGLDIFIRHFEEYQRHYVLIGGSACDWHMEAKGLLFRATKDLDIVLVVEALNAEFVTHFWQFIKNGQYKINEVDEKKRFYRFLEPAIEGYPQMIELFSRKPDAIILMEGMHLTDIPTDDELSSLSAILLDDDYYLFTIENTIQTEGLAYASEAALIVLKAKAFLNNRKRKAEGQQVREEDILKHKRDVVRLTATLDPTVVIEPQASIKEDLVTFLNILTDEKTAVRDILKKQGAGNVSLEEIAMQIQTTFKLRMGE